MKETQREANEKVDRATRYKQILGLLKDYPERINSKRDSVQARL